VPAEGFEPPTYGLQNRCTTTVLSRHSGRDYSRAGVQQAVVLWIGQSLAGTAIGDRGAGAVRRPLGCRDRSRGRTMILATRHQRPLP
jgi:hypothetical protein